MTHATDTTNRLRRMAVRRRAASVRRCRALALMPVVLTLAVWLLALALSLAPAHGQDAACSREWEPCFAVLTLTAGAQHVIQLPSSRVAPLAACEGGDDERLVLGMGAMPPQPPVHLWSLTRQTRVLGGAKAGATVTDFTLTRVRPAVVHEVLSAAQWPRDCQPIPAFRPGGASTNASVMAASILPGATDALAAGAGAAPPGASTNPKGDDDASSDEDRPAHDDARAGLDSGGGHGGQDARREGAPGGQGDHGPRHEPGRRGGPADPGSYRPADGREPRLVAVDARRAPGIPAAPIVSTSPECGGCPEGGPLTQARWPGGYEVRLAGGGTQAARADPRAAPQAFLSVPQVLAPLAMKATASSPPVPVPDRDGLLEAVRRLCEEYVPGVPSTGRVTQELREVSE